MNASEITFGVEIECYLPTGTIAAGRYHHGMPIAGYPDGWNAQHDGSLRTRRRGFSGIEIVSPVLKGVDGLRQVREVVAKLHALGAAVNDRCGLHVHIGVGNDLALVRKIVYLAANFETAVYAATGTKSRERGVYCRPISREFRSMGFETISAMGAAASDRYRVLNVSNLTTGGKQTVEFRAFAGTLNFEKIAASVRLCVAMVEKASNLKRVPKWTPPLPVVTSPLHRKGGVGQTQMTRLFYGIGWIKGDRNPVFGNLTGDGLPSIGNSKKTLMRLARKYDAAP